MTRRKRFFPCMVAIKSKQRHEIADGILILTNFAALSIKTVLNAESTNPRKQSQDQGSFPQLRHNVPLH